MTDDQEAARRAYEERSWRELEAGRLPLRAQERLASMEADHAFTSDLSAAEHLAVRGVGFEPVGQVMGASVFQIGYTGGWDCGVRNQGGPWGGGGYGRGGGMGGFNSGGFSGQGMGGGGFNGGIAGGIGGGIGAGMGGMGARGYGNLIANTVTVTPWRAALLQAQQLALSRMTQETKALGGDGVVAVRFRENALGNGIVEFYVIGTAVRAAGRRHLTGTFSSALSGQDFARLLHSGHMPVRLLFGVAVMTRHDDYQTRYAARSWANVELDGYTTLVTDTRAGARLQMAREAATVGAESVVFSDSYERISEHECYLIEGGRDHVVRTTYVGTGVVSLPHRSKSDALPKALPILRLSDRNLRDIER